MAKPELGPREPAPAPSRRNFLGAGRAVLVGGALLGAAFPAGAPRGDAPGTLDPSLPTDPAAAKLTAAQLRGLPSLDDFGAAGDGRTDDRAAVQAALDWVGQDTDRRRLRVPPRMFGLRGPILAPQGVELIGEVPGAGNHPVCGFRALPGFVSPHVMRYGQGGGMRTMPVAALLMTKEWTEGSRFTRRLRLLDLFFDVDSVTAADGSPVHGVMLANQQLDLRDLWVRHATGFGVWVNTQCTDGGFMRPIVDNVLRRVWVRGAGLGDATFRTDAGTFRYGGFLLGALPGTRDAAGRPEPAVATDGIMDYCTVAVGPEAGVGCRGNGIHITNAAGWRVVGCHLNGAGRHAVVLAKAFETELSGCYLDGWGVAAGPGEGLLAGIGCGSLIATRTGADGALVVSGNRLRARAVASRAGNRFVAVSVRAGAAPTPRAVIIGNAVTAQSAAAPRFALLDFGRSGRGQLEVVVVGNVGLGHAATFLRPWPEAAVRARLTGNNFQFAIVPPGAGWHPAGIRVDNATPEAGGWSGWVSTAAGNPGTWRGYGRIDG